MVFPQIFASASALFRNALIGLALALGGCAGASVAKIAPATELPTEVNQKDRFEVKEHLSVTPAAAETKLETTLPVETHSKTKKGKKKKSKKGQKAEQVVSTESAPAASDDAGLAKLDPKIIYPSRRPVKDPIWLGEKQILEISYFGVSGGDFVLEVLPAFKAINNRKVYQIRGTAISSKLFSMFYRLNDVIESFLDYDSLFSHRFHIVLDETKQARDSLELYDPEKKQTFYWNRWNRFEKGYTETKEWAPIAPMSQDTMSALFYLRTIPLPEGSVVTVPIVSEGKSWEAVVTVVRREMMDTPIGRIRTVVVKPEMKFQGILKKQGDSFLWLTDDSRRFLVRMEAKVKIGTVIAALKRVEAGTEPEPSPEPSQNPTAAKP